MNKFYCPLPFKHVFVAPFGIRSCCSYTGSYEGSISDYLESDLIKYVQTCILQHKIPTGCRGCYEAEQKTNQSTRLIALADYNNEFYNKTDIDYIDLRLSNLCNLKCRTCNPTFSTRISSEVKKHINELREFHPEMSINIEDKILTYTVDDNIKYIIDNVKNIKKLNFTGGEPTYIPEIRKILDQYSDLGYNGNILITSNLNFTDNFWITLTKEWAEQIHWSISIDAIGKEAEILRHGSNWQLIDKNIHKICNTSNSVEFNITITNMNIKYIGELLLYINSIKLKYNDKSNGMNIRISPCWAPDYLSPTNITKDIANKVEGELLLLLNNDLHPDINSSIIEVLDIIKHNEISDVLWNKYVRFNDILNDIRGENLNV